MAGVLRPDGSDHVAVGDVAVAAARAEYAEAADHIAVGDAAVAAALADAVEAADHNAIGGVVRIGLLSIDENIRAILSPEMDEIFSRCRGARGRGQMPPAYPQDDRNK